MTNDDAVTKGLGLIHLKEMVKPLPSGFHCGVDPKQETKASPGVPSKTENHLPMLVDWHTKLVKTLSESFPQLTQDKALQEPCEAVVAAHHAKEDAVKKRDAISKQKPPDPDLLGQANQEVAETEAELQKQIKESTTIVKQIIERPAIQSILANDYDDCDLVTCTVMTEATPAKLAKWCEQGPDHAKQLIDFLHNVDLMRVFLRSGGARMGEYPRAVEIYHQIKPNPSNPVLQRLALAIALELCAPIPLFGNAKESVDPFQRYIHYEQAYLLGELDVSFSQFNVWEMRQIVNSDATEEELAWGRRSLMNYRPDLVNSDNKQWRYCMIVKTDVSYKTPDWYV